MEVRVLDTIIMFLLDCQKIFGFSFQFQKFIWLVWEILFSINSIKSKDIMMFSQVISCLFQMPFSLANFRKVNEELTTVLDPNPNYP